MALTDNLVSYWKLDESTGTREDSHSTHDLALGTEPGATTGKIGDAASFTASGSEFLTAGNDAAFDNPSTFTCAYWFKGSDTSDAIIFSKLQNNNNAGWSIGITTAGTGLQHCLLQSTGAAAYKQRKGATNICDGNWHFVVVDWDGTNNNNSSAGIHIYVDNGADEGAESGSSGTLGSMSTATEVNMGRAGAGTAFYITAVIDEFGFWTRVLTSDERTTLYNGGAGLTYPFSAGASASHLLLMGV